MDRTGCRMSGVARRDFLISTSLAAGGLLLHGAVPEWAAREVEAGGAGSAGATMLNAWIRIAPDNTVTIISSQAEMGQGIQTTLPAVLADELGADWNHVRLENAPADPAY